MPKYVTESGYEEFEDVRTRVGRNAPLPHALWLVDVAAGKVARAEVRRACPASRTDPLAALRKAAGKDAAEGQPRGAHRDRRRRHRPGDPLERRRPQRRGAGARDRQQGPLDRHASTPPARKLQARHRLDRPAWINWDFNDFGWMPDDRTLWFLSEQSGYSHLYTSATATAQPRALTSGKWEVSTPQLSPTAARFYFVCNRALARATTKSARSTPTAARCAKSPRSTASRISRCRRTGRSCWCAIPTATCRRSWRWSMPTATACAQLTDTRKPAVQGARLDRAARSCRCRRKHGAGTIWGKYYGPATAGSRASSTRS